MCNLFVSAFKNYNLNRSYLMASSPPFFASVASRLPKTEQVMLLVGKAMDRRPAYANGFSNTVQVALAGVVLAMVSTLWASLGPLYY
jgi:hypothetical protein